MAASGGLMLQAPPVTAVLLAGGGGSRLHPLNAAGTPKVLLPVANRPLLTFPLRMLEEGGVGDVLVVCEGDMAAQAVRAWLAGSYSGPLRIEVVRVADGLPAVDALRAVIDRVRTDNFVLLSGDVVAETSLRTQLLTHYVREAALTALLGRRRVLASSETKPGRAPRGVDYVGLASGTDRLALFVHSPDTVKQLLLPPSFLAAFPAIDVRTDLVDMQVYVFHTATLRAVLAANEKLKHLEEQLVPHMVRYQLKPRRSVGPEAATRLAAARSPPPPPAGSMSGLEGSLADLSLSGMSGSSAGGGGGGGGGGGRGGEWYCCAFVAPEGSFCQRVNTLQGFADVNRDVVAPGAAARVLREDPHPAYDNFVPGSVVLGPRCTVSAGALVGPDCVLGERVSVKRSVLGAACALGAGTKVQASVLLDDVRTGPGASLRGCVLGAGASVGEGARLVDCWVGPGYAVPAGAELSEEVLPPPPHRD